METQISQTKIDTKKCTRCKKDKPISDFNKDRFGIDGLRYWCKECSRSSSKNWYYKNQEKQIISGKKYRSSKRGQRKTKIRVLKQYNMTLAQYDQMFEQQKGDCAICKLPEIMTRLVVDHDHKTGKVRGLLCHRCNRVLGSVEDNIDLIKNMSKYLEMK